MTDCCIIITTTDQADIADMIATSLIEEDLAKCVWQEQVTATYMWEGNLVRDFEYKITAKANIANSTKIMQHIKEIHNYSMPGIVQINIDNGNPDYLNWVKGNVNERS